MIAGGNCQYTVYLFLYLIILLIKKFINMLFYFYIWFNHKSSYLLPYLIIMLIKSILFITHSFVLQIDYSQSYFNQILSKILMKRLIFFQKHQKHLFLLFYYIYCIHYVSKLMCLLQIKQRFINTSNCSRVLQCC